MSSPRPPDWTVIVRAFEVLPELKTAGALAGANALHHEHLENHLGRYSFDIDLQNQAEELEVVHRRFPVSTRQLKLISRLSEDIYEYQVRVGRHVLRVEIARPYLRHRRKYQPSRHISGLQVVSLPDLLFAKVSAFSTRGFTRDLIDLFAVDQQKKVDWPRLLLQASCATDNDYNPAEFHRKLQQHLEACGKPDYWQEAPVTHPPTTAELRRFVQNLLAANRQVARTTLE